MVEWTMEMQATLTCNTCGAKHNFICYEENNDIDSDFEIDVEATGIGWWIDGDGVKCEECLKDK